MPTHLTLPAILALSNAFPEDREMRYRQIKKPTDSKIKTLVLQQIVQVIERKAGALFPSATAPRVVIGFLSSLHAPKKQREERIKLVPSKARARPAFRSSSNQRIPIGLRRCEPHNWINSLIQFFIYLPGTWELFSLLPRSFQLLREFADQYFADQEENRTLSSADSAELVRFLLRKLPPQFLYRKPTLYDILSAITKALFPQCPFSAPGEIHPVVLHPEWHVPSSEDYFEEAFQKKMTEGPHEILIGIKESPCPLKGHYFASTDGASYDLSAFIELRPDGDHGDHFIAYLKNQGVWYQCDDDRVIQFRSNCLNAPLRRATLLHYRRVDFSGRNKMYFKK